MYGAHVRFDQKSGSWIPIAWVTRSAISQVSQYLRHAQDRRQNLGRLRRQICKDSSEVRLRLGVSGIARNILTAPVAHCLGGMMGQDSG